jgi:hypothetical protein
VHEKESPRECPPPTAILLLGKSLLGLSLHAAEPSAAIVRNPDKDQPYSFRGTRLLSWRTSLYSVHSMRHYYPFRSDNCVEMLY